MHINKKVGILMGSDSDFSVMREAAEILKSFGVDFEITVISAHRTPEKAYAYAKEAEDNGLGVIIAGAGGAAHLAGVIASLTPLPVIGVPILSKSLSGMDSLLSMVQMPKGIPVACVAINGAANAGLLASQILGVSDYKIRSKIKEYKEKIKNDVEKKAEDIKKIVI